MNKGTKIAIIIGVSILILILIISGFFFILNVTPTPSSSTPPSNQSRNYTQYNQKCICQAGDTWLPNQCIGSGEIYSDGECYIDNITPEQAKLLCDNKQECVAFDYVASDRRIFFKTATSPLNDYELSTAYIIQN